MNETSKHIPYADLKGQHPDFQIDYVIKIDKEIEGIIPCQGMRCDFRYKSEDILYMVYPEILDRNGKIITSKDVEIASQGKALMWIFGDKQPHRKKLFSGIEGYWVAGSYILAEVVVTHVFFDKHETIYSCDHGNHYETAIFP